MATLAGSVTINPTTGAATGSGMALALFNLMIANPPYSGINTGVAGVTAQAVINVRTEVARVCNVFATISDGPQWLITAPSSAYNANPWEFVLTIASSSFAITLPVPSAANVGTCIRVKKISGGGTVTVVTSGGSTIDGAASVTIATMQCLEFTCDGSKWWVAANST